MLRLGPSIRDLFSTAVRDRQKKTWMVGTRPTMTVEGGAGTQRRSAALLRRHRAAAASRRRGGVEAVHVVVEPQQHGLDRGGLGRTEAVEGDPLVVERGRDELLGQPP